jgi:ferredoxin-thioredoxin reductase catalytic subunit
MNDNKKPNSFTLLNIIRYLLEHPVRRGSELLPRELATGNKQISRPYICTC